ncbi:MAG TPA: hypothetical protein VF601_08120 [Beijerinckiaceae bacterium]|jgi:lambda repressor-like predicted transcriptional regulator
MPGPEPDSQSPNGIVEQILAAMRRKGIARGKLATKALLDEKTVRNVLKGRPARDDTIASICRALDLELDRTNEIPELSDEAHGSYLRAQYRDYAGYFYVYRRSYIDPKRILRTIFELAWAEQRKCITFSDYTQFEFCDKMNDYRPKRRFVLQQLYQHGASLHY